jgi:superfamily II DNA/RNA helicase
VCNHPFLFGEPRDVSGRFYGEANPELLALASGKFRLLDRMLPKLKERGHKVLIFSQMTKLLDILEDYLSIYQYKFCRIDGSCKVNHRQSSIDRFNSDPSYFVFLLSTRAGGLGINLTSADTCILFDSDWNPHQDSQAQDRCHRIGQTRPVIVYRLLTAGSIEIEVMEKQISKKKLERLTIHGGDFRRAGHRLGSQLTLSNLRKLLDDDVKNLKRMIRNPSNAKTLTSYFNNFQIENNDQSEGNTSTATLSTLDDGSSASCDISPSDRPSPGSQKSRRGSKKSSCRSSSSSVNNEESADGPVSTISFDEITDRELDIIMNREKIFSAFEVVKNEVAPLDAEGMSSKRPCSDVETIPIEGEMYDIITSTESQSGVLMALS